MSNETDDFGSVIYTDVVPAFDVARDTRGDVAVVAGHSPWTGFVIRVGDLELTAAEARVLLAKVGSAVAHLDALVVTS